MNKYLGLIFFGITLIILAFSLYDDWVKYKFKIFEFNQKKIPIKSNKPIISKRTIKYQNRIINASIRTKI